MKSISERIGSMLETSTTKKGPSGPLSMLRDSRVDDALIREVSRWLFEAAPIQRIALCARVLIVDQVVLAVLHDSIRRAVLMRDTIVAIG
ncbi:MAG: hypothetical protein JSW10_02480 [Pseudomonadota bacterium]|nr:MAG: hypothetical protein JSW10_02480 [Pseudomonadota bacterium]